MSTPPPYVRRDIWSLETAVATNSWDPVTLAYAKAVAAMQARPISDPTSWAYQAAMHGTYASPPRGAGWNRCQHASWHFLPWHRIYIYWFERIVRAAVIAHGGPHDWALPYWNYSRGFPANTLPPAFRVTALPDGSANPLYVAQRNADPPPGVNGGAQIPDDAASYAYAFQFTEFTQDAEPFGFGGVESPATQFDSGTGQLENQPHNIIHDLVGGEAFGECAGGLMSDPMCAAADPIFWLHHANIDRLWPLWIAQGDQRANPTDPNWLNQPFTFYDENGAAVVMTAAQVLDTVAQLGYRYDDQLPAVTRRFAAGMSPSPPSPSPPPGGPQLVAASAGGIDLTGKPSSVDIELPSTARDAVRAAAAAEPSRIYLSVEDVQAKRHPGVVYQVFVNLPQDAPTPGARDSHFVGHVTFFTARHAVGGHKQTYDITGLVQEQTARGLWHDDRVKVTFSPLGLLPPPMPSREAAPSRPRRSRMHPCISERSASSGADHGRRRALLKIDLARCGGPHRFRRSRSRVWSPARGRSPPCCISRITRRPSVITGSQAATAPRCRSSSFSGRGRS